MKNLILTLTIMATLVATKASSTTYYFSTSDGDDSRTTAQAQSSSTPWKTLTKLNSFFSSLQAGDVVLFKSGDVFYGSINVTKAGSSAALISFGAYGSGPRPVITGMTDATSFTSVGTSLWESAAISNGATSALQVFVNGI
ncbi:MAG TPA: hypothetical protein VGC95_03815, partial [Chitinophagaceae bacterium]